MAKIILLSLVILLITSITFYVLKEKERKLRIYTQEQLTQTVAEKKVVENKLAEAIKAKEKAESKIQTVTQKTSETTRIVISTVGPVKFNSHKMPKIISKGRPEVVKDIPIEPLKSKQPMIILVWLAGLLPISGLGFWFWRKVKLFEQEQKASKTAEEWLSQKEKEVAGVEGPLEFLKEVLVEKRIAKKFTTVGEEGELWIAGKSAERRKFLRLDLSRDYNPTIILRIESAGKSKSMKSSVSNIGLGGLSFKTRHEFSEKEKQDMQLFFLGDKVPMARIQARVIWSKFDTPPVKRYGISFTCQEERGRMNLCRYVISNQIYQGGVSDGRILR